MENIYIVYYAFITICIYNLYLYKILYIVSKGRDTSPNGFNQFLIGVEVGKTILSDLFISF